MINNTNGIGFLTEKTIQQYNIQQNSNNGNQSGSSSKQSNLRNTNLDQNLKDIPQRIHNNPFNKNAQNLINNNLVENEINRLEKNHNSPLSIICRQTLFEAIPSEWFMKPVNEWPLLFPYDIQSNLKSNLLENKIISKNLLINEKTLTESILKGLAMKTYTRIRDFIQELPKEGTEILLSKKRMDLNFILRTNFELNPFIANSFTMDPVLKINSGFKAIPIQDKIVDLTRNIYKLYELKNKAKQAFQKCYEQSLILHTLTLYPVKSGEELFVFDEDHLLIFIAQILPEKVTDKSFITKLFKECSKSTIHQELLNPSSDSAVEIVINKLQEIAPFLGEDSYPQLLKQFYACISEYLQPVESSGCPTFRRNLWLKCGDTLYGLFFPLYAYLPFQKIWNYLSDSPPLSPHSETIAKLNQEFFEGKSNELASLAYKYWWFGQYKNGKPQALAERVIDWHLYEYLDHRGERLKEDEVINTIEKTFREKYPVLPFNRIRAEALFFTLKLGSLGS